MKPETIVLKANGSKPVSYSTSAYNIHDKNGFDGIKHDLRGVTVISDVDKGGKKDRDIKDKKNKGRNNTTVTADEGSDDKTFKFLKLPRHKKFVLIICLAAAFLIRLSASLIIPIYPILARDKGQGIFMVGVIFATHDFVNFVMSPFIGKYVMKMFGPRVVFIAGIVVGGVGQIFFGLLEIVPSGMTFQVVGMVVRVIESAGFCACITSTFAIVSNEFPKHVGTTLAMVMAARAFGYMIGAFAGGGLADVGGYGLPFYVFGVVVILNGLLGICNLSDIEYVTNPAGASIFSLLKSPLIVVALLSVFVGFSSFNSFNTLIAQHLDPFHLSPVTIGLILAGGAVLYSLLSRLWGYLSDTKSIHGYIISIGHSILCIAYLLMGPDQIIFPFAPFEMWFILPVIYVIYLFIGASLIPTMMCIVIGALELGFHNNIETYAFVAGVYNSIFCLGGAAGPVISGTMAQAYGNAAAFSLVAYINLVMASIAAAYFVSRKIRRQTFYKQVAASNVQPLH